MKNLHIESDTPIFIFTLFFCNHFQIGDTCTKSYWDAFAFTLCRFVRHCGLRFFESHEHKIYHKKSIDIRSLSMDDRHEVEFENFFDTFFSFSRKMLNRYTFFVMFTMLFFLIFFFLAFFHNFSLDFHAFFYSILVNFCFLFFDKPRKRHLIREFRLYSQTIRDIIGNSLFDWLMVRDVRLYNYVQIMA